MADYYSIITQRGKMLEADALANGTKISLTHFVVGDSKGQELKPDPALNSLINETWRSDIADLIVSPEQATQMMARLVLPPNIGGFTVREIGLLTDAGELYAVANCPAIDKPVGGVSVNLQFRLAVSDTSNITLNVATGDGLFLRQDANLSDVKDKALSRKNIGLGTAATQNVGVTPGSVMRVDDFAHGCFAAEMGVRRVLTGSNPPTAPGVWTVANSSWTPLPYGGLFYTTNSGDLSVGSADGRFNNYIFIGYGNAGEPVIYYATDVNGRFSGWSTAYTTINKPAAADVDAWSKDESNGRFAYKSITVNGKPLSSNVNLAAGDVNAWNKTESDGRFIFSAGDTINGNIKNSKEFQSTSPNNYRIISGNFGTFWRSDGNALYLLITNANDQYGSFNNLRPFSVNLQNGDANFGHALTVAGPLTVGKNLVSGGDLIVDGHDFITKRGTNPAVNNERGTCGYRIRGGGNLFADIFHNERIGTNHYLGIHVANGGADGWYEFRNDGSFHASNTLNAGSARLYGDGNISGSKWGGYLSDWLNTNISNAQNSAQSWAYQNLVQNVRLTGRINQADTGGQVRVPDGCVFTGMSGANYNPSIWASYSYVQVLINGSWRNIGTS